MDNNGNALETYGEINSWDVSLFPTCQACLKTNFNLMMNYLIGDEMLKISRSMFMSYCFNQDLSNWDVSNVLNMQSLFMYASFNNNIKLECF